LSSMVREKYMRDIKQEGRKKTRNVSANRSSSNCWQGTVALSLSVREDTGTKGRSSERSVPILCAGGPVF